MYLIFFEKCKDVLPKEINLIKIVSLVGNFDVDFIKLSKYFVNLNKSSHGSSHDKLRGRAMHFQN